MTWFSIASLFRNIKYISINTFFQCSFWLRMCCYRYLPYNHRRRTIHRKHKRELHGFFVDVLQLHQVKFSISIGATSRSIFIGPKVSFIWYQLQTNRFNHSRSKLLHLQTCKWIGKSWKYVALSDGGKFWELKEFYALHKPRMSQWTENVTFFHCGYKWRVP